MINYILQVILFQTLFLAVYDIWLSKETFFVKNRWYLLSASVVSFVLPLVKIPFFKKAISKEYIALLPEIVLSPQQVLESTNWYQSINYVTVLFWLGCLFFIVLFLVKLIYIFKLIFKNEKIKQPNYTLVLLPRNTKAFSFFNYIFLGKEISLEKRDNIIRHELVHGQQKHTFDLLFFELLKIAMWFNPLVYVYQKRVLLVHEYISDDIITKSTEKKTYINSILSDLFQVESISFINQFYKQSLIKKRVVMLTKQKSKQINQVKYLLLVPVLAAMLFYVSCSKNDTKKDVEEVVEVIEEVPMTTIKEVEEIQEVAEVEEIEEVVEEVSFNILEKAPVFPGCKGSKDDIKDCFSKSVKQHFVREFDTDLTKKINLKKKLNKIHVDFRIGKTGTIDNIKVRAPHKKIEEEIIRVMKKLPKMQPAKIKGKVVAVKYSIPFTLVVE